MKINSWNRATLHYIHPFARKSQDINALLFWFEFEGTNKRERTTINIPASHFPKYKLFNWLEKMGIESKNLDLKNPNTLKEQISNAAEGVIYDVFIKYSKNGKYINIEDIKVSNIN